MWIFPNVPRRSPSSMRPLLPALPDLLLPVLPENPMQPVPPVRPTPPAKVSEVVSLDEVIVVRVWELQRERQLGSQQRQRSHRITTDGWQTCDAAPAPGTCGPYKYGKQALRPEICEACRNNFK